MPTIQDLVHGPEVFILCKDLFDEIIGMTRDNVAMIFPKVVINLIAKEGQTSDNAGKVMYWNYGRATESGNLTT